MKRLLLASVAVVGLLGFSGSAAQAQFGYGHGYGGFNGAYQPRSTYGQAGHSYGSGGYGYRAPHLDYHDTTHRDYHPGSFQRHRGHYDYVPGHYDVHREGHWDRH